MRNVSKTTKDRNIVLEGDFPPGHEIEVIVQAVDIGGIPQAEEDSPKVSIVIAGKTDAPQAGVDATAVAFLTTIYLAWTNPTDLDFKEMDIWASTVNDQDFAVKVGSSTTEDFTHSVGTAGITYYYWFYAYNTSGKRSGIYPDSQTSTITATTIGIVPTDIEDFAVTASKFFNKIPVITADTWSNNTPGVGRIAWNAHNICYNGAYYLVAAGNTTNATFTHIYWDVGNTGGSGTVADPYITTYSENAGAPAMTDTRFIIAMNISGTHNVAWNSIANQVVGTAYILDAAVETAKIKDLNVTTGKIALLAVDTAQIAALAVETAKIDNLAVTDAKINTLGVNKLTAGTISSKVITLAVTPAAGDCYIGAGKTDFTNAQVGFILGIDDSDADRAKFFIGNTTEYLNWDGQSMYVTGAVIRTANSGARFDILSPDSGTIRAIDDDGNTVLEILVGGANVGDVTIGDFASNTGCKWDKSAATFTIRGTLNADDLVAGTVTGRRIQTAAAGQRAVMDISDNTIRLLNAGGDTLVLIDDNITVATPGIQVGDGVSINGYFVADNGTNQSWMSSLSSQMVQLHIVTKLFGTGYIDIDGNIDTAGYVDAVTGFKDNGTPGVDGTFEDHNGNTVTVSGGIITDLTT